MEGFDTDYRLHPAEWMDVDEEGERLFRRFWVTDGRSGGETEIGPFKTLDEAIAAADRCYDEVASGETEANDLYPHGLHPDGINYVTIGLQLEAQPEVDVGPIVLDIYKRLLMCDAMNDGYFEKMTNEDLGKLQDTLTDAFWNWANKRFGLAVETQACQDYDPSRRVREAGA